MVVKIMKQQAMKANLYHFAWADDILYVAKNINCNEYLFEGKLWAEVG